METLYLLIPLSVLLIAGVAYILVWAIRSGQYDDLDRAAHQILLDDDDRGRDADPGEAEAPRSQSPEE